MKVFFGGIIQGSIVGKDIHSQNYRKRIIQSLKSSYPEINIFDPVENHEDSVHYDDDRARQVFFDHLGILRTCDLMIAFLPEASLGTAIEMREAYEHEIPILTISPMTHNWVIRIMSARNFLSVDEFADYISANDIFEIYNGKKKHLSESRSGHNADLSI